MEPQLMTGDMVVTGPVDPQAVVVGDIITFHHSGEVESLISHRVMAIEPVSPPVFITKGDANEAADPFTTPARDVVGRISFHCPRLGNAVLFLKTVPGLMASLVIPGVVIIGICLNSIHGELIKRKGVAG
ncbi:MAG: signal peptidase I, partial [Dehalococcoidales bacterium]|nr:signal peptidase I [Dehalococcoidales bacterium]